VCSVLKFCRSSESSGIRVIKVCVLGVVELSFIAEALGCSVSVVQNSCSEYQGLFLPECEADHSFSHVGVVNSERSFNFLPYKIHDSV
jgi:hypothetical protein